MSFLDPIMDYLSTHQADPLTYLLIFFLFCVLAAIILPIPIEAGLVWQVAGVPNLLFFPVKALVMGLGKGTGAVAVFFIGAKIENTFFEFSKWRWFRWLVNKSEASVRRHGILSLYALMSIPFMVDTAPLYVFSILNKEGKLITLRDFAFSNFLAGINRAFAVYAGAEFLGWFT